MHLNQDSYAGVPGKMRRKHVRVAITALLVSGAAVAGTTTPASAFYPPVEPGYYFSGYAWSGPIPTFVGPNTLFTIGIP